MMNPLVEQCLFGLGGIVIGCLAISVPQLLIDYRYSRRMRLWKAGIRDKR